MEYIATVSGSSTKIDKVKNKLLESNPILEGKKKKKKKKLLESNPILEGKKKKKIQYIPIYNDIKNSHVVTIKEI